MPAEPPSKKKILLQNPKVFSLPVEPCSRNTGTHQKQNTLCPSPNSGRLQSPTHPKHQKVLQALYPATLFFNYTLQSASCDPIHMENPLLFGRAREGLFSEKPPLASPAGSLTSRRTTSHPPAPGGNPPPPGPECAPGPPPGPERAKNHWPGSPRRSAPAADAAACR